MGIPRIESNQGDFGVLCASKFDPFFPIYVLDYHCFRGIFIVGMRNLDFLLWKFFSSLKYFVGPKNSSIEAVTAEVLIILSIDIVS